MALVLRFRCICTDDFGVFNITLSSEYEKLTEAFEMNKQHICEFALSTIEHIFETSEFKKKLRSEFETIIQTL